MDSDVDSDVLVAMLPRSKSDSALDALQLPGWRLPREGPEDGGGRLRVADRSWDGRGWSRCVSRVLGYLLGLQPAPEIDHKQLHCYTIANVRCISLWDKSPAIYIR